MQNQELLGVIIKQNEDKFEKLKQEIEKNQEWLATTIKQNEDKFEKLTKTTQYSKWNFK